MGFIGNVASNVIANVVFWLGLGISASVAIKISQRRFRSFFGLNKVAVLTTCLSNRWLASASERPRGYLVSLHELRAAESVRALFGSASFRLPDITRGLVDTLFLGTEKYSFETVVSPAMTDDPGEFENLGQNLIVVGGALGNGVRRLYLSENRLHVQLSNEERPELENVEPLPNGYARVMSGPDSGKKVEHEGLDIAVVEKIRDNARGVVVFFCLGVRGDTTWAAVEYLVRNWRQLHREFENEPFALCLGFMGQNYSYDYREPRRLLTV